MMKPILIENIDKTNGDSSDNSKSDDATNKIDPRALKIQEEVQSVKDYIYDFEQELYSNDKAEATEIEDLVENRYKNEIVEELMTQSDDDNLSFLDG